MCNLVSWHGTHETVTGVMKGIEWWHVAQVERGVEREIGRLCCFEFVLFVLVM